MKRFIFSLLVILLGISNVNYAQGNSFEWTDSTFTIGAKKEIKIIPLGYCNDEGNNEAIVDSIIVFMNENPTLKVNIIFNSDERGTEAANQALTQRFAEQFRKYLIHYGVKRDRIVPIGMGESKPLISTEIIGKLKTKEEKEAAHRMNRRVEIQIAEM